MDNVKRLILLVFLFFSNSAFSSVYNFSLPGSGSLRSSPTGNTAHASGGANIEGNRIRSAPKFTFGTAAGKQVGFTASRLSTISTARVGSAFMTVAKSVGPVGLTITAATLLCTNTDICTDATGLLFESPAQFDGNEFPATTGEGEYVIIAGESFPSPDAACTSWGNGPVDTETASWSGQLQSDTVCDLIRTTDAFGDEVFGSIGISFSPTGCADNYNLAGGSCILQGSNTPGEPSDADFDAAAPLMNDDALAPDLLASPGGLPVDAPDAMAPQGQIVSSETTTLKDAQGNVTGSQVTERSIDITDVSDANNPNSFDITEKKTVTNFDINNNVTNSTETTINNEQPPAEPPEDFEIDDMPESKLENYEFSNTFTYSSWGSGSCPADRSISYSYGTLDLAMQPACTFAEGIKPIVLLLAGLTALTIISGIRTS